MLRHHRGMDVRDHYATEDRLLARQRLWAESPRRPPFHLQSWVVGLARLRGDERVLDVGCGNGAYLERAAVELLGPLVDRGAAAVLEHDEPAARDALFGCRTSLARPAAAGRLVGSVLSPPEDEGSGR